MKKLLLDKIINDITEVTRKISKKKKNIYLHQPLFYNNEYKFLKKCISTTHVSSGGKYIGLFENQIKRFTNSTDVIAVLNGTIGLQICLEVLGIQRDDEVLVPAMTFVGTVNAIKHANANPIFLDSDLNNLGINFDKLQLFLRTQCIKKNGYTYNRKTKKRVFGIMPVHVFGNIGDIEKIIKIAKKYKLKVIEDAAEALGSYYNDKHAGNFGDLGLISFNANKTITTGGGGVILSNNKYISKKIRHLISTAKIKHAWKFLHDQVGWNYKMTNLNAAVGYAQALNLDKTLIFKKKLGRKYSNLFMENKMINIVKPPINNSTNNWLNVIKIKGITEKNRDYIISILNEKKIECRPVWRLMSKLPMYKKYQKINLDIAQRLEKELICLPSSPIYGKNIK
jgi:perosamine synthetase